MKKIGILTSGGDCQALNATMRGVVKGLENLFGEIEIYGFKDGYKGLIYGNYREDEANGIFWYPRQGWYNSWHKPCTF